MDDWVGELRLRVRGPIPDTAAVRGDVERLARVALERGAALLEARHPGRVVLLRQLPLRWRLDEDTLGEEGPLEELASHLADRIEMMALPTGLVPPAGADAVHFADEALWRASYLLAKSEGRLSWCHAALEEASGGEALQVVLDPSSGALAGATLAHLARANRLAVVLAPLSPANLERLERVLAAGPMASHLMPTGAESRLSAELAALTASWPPLSPGGRQLALRVHQAVALETTADADEASPSAERWMTAPGAAWASGDRTVVAPPPESSPAAPRPADQSPGWRRPRDDAPGHGSLSPQDHLDPPRGFALVPPASPPGPADAAPSPIATRHAGLFFLCDRLGELDLPESLWQACLPEGLVLAEATAWLLGPAGAGDAAPLILGGVERLGDWPEVTLDQLGEVAAATLGALAAALPRRGLATIPPLALTLTEQAGGRLLTACAEGSPFVVFAWPADRPEAIQAGLRLLLSRWPAGCPVGAEPALIRLDGSGRLRPLVASSRPERLVPAEGAAAMAALLALVVGAPALLFTARAASAGEDKAVRAGGAAAVLSRHLRRRGWIHVSEGRLEIQMTAAANPLTLRKAGLDRDPGWLPWLRRDVVFRFVAREPLPPGGEWFDERRGDGHEG
ncbi:MAG: hypothetical protein VKP63_09975 [Cyanobacteriota bacterium]|nr:hypothetical protein [Cyanobacteriota bacterium]